MPADLTTHLRAMADYNAWANRRLYGAAAQLAEDRYHAPAGVYFGSLHGTLNHLLVVDRIWLGRLLADGVPAPRLDAILFDSLRDLHAARLSEDSRITGYVASLSADDLAFVHSFHNSRGVAFSQPRWQTLAHLFNHQTHHRGQAHAALTRLGVAEPPALDLAAMQREKAAAQG